MKKLQITKDTLVSLSDAEGHLVAAGRPPTIDGAGCTDVYCYTDNCYTIKLTCSTCPA
jgi:hypothetical protein